MFLSITVYLGFNLATRLSQMSSTIGIEMKIVLDRRESLPCTHLWHKTELDAGSWWSSRSHHLVLSPDRLTLKSSQWERESIRDRLLAPLYRLYWLGYYMYSMRPTSYRRCAGKVIFLSKDAAFLAMRIIKEEEIQHNKILFWVSYRFSLNPWFSGTKDK